jgi:hypothetical protein
MGQLSSVLNVLCVFLVVVVTGLSVLRLERGLMVCRLSGQRRRRFCLLQSIPIQGALIRMQIKGRIAGEVGRLGRRRTRDGDKARRALGSHCARVVSLSRLENGQ